MHGTHTLVRSVKATALIWGYGRTAGEPHPSRAMGLLGEWSSLWALVAWALKAGIHPSWPQVPQTKMQGATSAKSTTVCVHQGVNTAGSTCPHCQLLGGNL